MTKEKLIYLAVVVISGVFFILYRDSLSLILFLVVLAIAPLLLVSVILMRIGVSIKITSGQSVYSYGEKAKFTLYIANYSPFPVSQIKVFANYKNAFFQHYDTGEFHFFAPPFSENHYEIEIDSRHSGKIDVLFKKARVMDYFGLFSLPIRINKTISVSFLPKTHILEPTLRKNNYAISEANLYSPHKPGDDPSEIFAIREYCDSDKISRIHWKLTSKYDKYLVKDYSLPINESVLLLPELIFGEGKEADLELIDTVLEITFSLSHVLVERKTLHSIGFYNTEADKVCIRKIGSLDDLYSVFGEIFNTCGYYANPVLAQLDADQYKNMSHVVYISANITNDHYNVLSAGKSEAMLYTAINVVENDTNEMTDGDLNIIPVEKNRIFECLNDAVL